MLTDELEGEDKDKDVRFIAVLPKERKKKPRDDEDEPYQKFLDDKMGPSQDSDIDSESD